ncbi:MAG: hypothetical protein AAGC60_05995 [Acidobacteriota bacterium]
MLGFLNQFAHKAELRESKDEILLGELVRVASRKGWPTISFQAGSDRQRVRFLTVGDPLLYSLFVTLDRRTGSGMIGEKLLGSKATLAFSAEIKNRLADPDDLVHMFRTDLANVFKMPVIGGVKLNHELNSVFATVTKIIEIGDFVLQGQQGTAQLQQMLDSTVGELRSKLEPYKKA